MAKKVKTNIKKTSIIDTFLDMLHSQREAHDRIYGDYLEGDSKMLDAIMAEDKAFTERIEALRANVSGAEDTFEINVGVDIIVEHLKEIVLEDDHTQDLLQILLDQDPDALFDHLKRKGYAFIQLGSLADKIKLEDFVKAEIYPYYNDRNKFSI